MKDIDLTKCNNCRFKAVVDGKEVTGRIEKSKTGFLLTGDDVFGCVVSYLELATMRGGTDPITDDGNFRISDFEIVPRDPEAYRDWQVGDTIEYSDNYSTGRIIFRGGDFVAADIEGTCNCYTCDELFNEGYRLVLTDIENQIIEKKKAEWKPQDGDICFVKTSAGNRFIFIKRDNESDDEIHGYITMATNSKSLYSSCVPCVCKRKSIRELRPATDEEKQMLFDALEKKGKRRNAEKKVVEDIPKPYEFKKGEPVLARNDFNSVWQIAVYQERLGDSERPHLVFDGLISSFKAWNCLPYDERTMHLLGTNEDYKEEGK